MPRVAALTCATKRRPKNGFEKGWNCKELLPIAIGLRLLSTPMLYRSRP